MLKNEDLSARQLFTVLPRQKPTIMYVIKRNNERQDADLTKIVGSIELCSEGLQYVDPKRLASKTFNGLFDGITTTQIDNLIIHTAVSFMREEPQYSKLATRLLSRFIEKDAKSVGVTDFISSIQVGYDNGLINERLYQFVQQYPDELSAMIDNSKDTLFEFMGIKTLFDRYLLRHPTQRSVIERPQHFFLRIAAALSREIKEVKPFYDLISSLDYLPSSPTLFNSGTTHEQLSSCFLIDSPDDDLCSIYDRYSQVAMLSKFAGGIGMAYHRVRSHGSLIRGTNGLSNGIIPFLHTFDASVAAVNQGGRRKGAACVYLETWHADIESFLELRDNTGEAARRAHNINIANWIPDIFMRRVEEDAEWSLFDPKLVPEFPDLYGKDFDEAYLRAEAAGLADKTMPARDLYRRMMRTLAQTGNGWFAFKDRSNLTCNQTSDNIETDPEKVRKNRVVHLSNLCTEIIEVSSDKETAVCNLGSINLSHHVVQDENGEWFVDYEKIGRTVQIAIRHLDRVIDLNFYPIEMAKHSNMLWRPVGLGMMGLQDVFFKLHEPFDSEKARFVSRRIAEEVYYHAMKTSCELAKEFGPHENFSETRTAKGELQFDYWKTKPEEAERFELLREEIKTYGLRNSLTCAVAPTATIASIAGCYECIEPQVSNLFKRETLSGDFMQINRYLVEDLRKLDLWNPEMCEALLAADGSVQGLEDLTPELRAIYRTVWETEMRSIIDMAAERGAFIDQSQSLNLFYENPNISALSAMYRYAWKSGLKTCYYLRSRPATQIAKTTISSTSSSNKRTLNPGKAPQACSLENPEYCEACQ